MKIAFFMAVFCLWVAVPPVFAAQPWHMSGKVIRVADGDTLTIMESDYSKVPVRLSDIDAPETSHGRKKPGQPFSQASKQSLMTQVMGHKVTATCYEVDLRKRSVCTVFVADQDVNLEQLRRGMAWVYQANMAYVRNPQSPAAHAQAQAAGVGLWAANSAKPIPPWQWRRDCWNNQVCDDAGE